MNHLVIYAHPNPASFNHAILEAYTRELAAAWPEVRIRDLYGTGFNPVFLQSDYDMIDRNTPLDDIRQGQDLFSCAGVMTFIFPVFWAGMPAMLKGWYYDSSISAFMGGPGRKVFQATTDFDKTVVDGAVNGVGTLVAEVSTRARLLQTGYVRNHALGLTIGVVVVVGLLFSKAVF